MKVYTFTGCIAVGKTTMAEKLADVLHLPIIYEEADENPYLESYYTDMQAFAMKMQLWYLNKRISQFMRSKQEPTVVQDQMLHAFGFIFPSLQLKNGHMTDGEFHSIMTTLNLFYERCWDLSGGLDEIIFYLRVREDDVPVLMKRIKEERGRECESSIEEEYLARLIAEYERWFERMSKKRVVVLDPLHNSVKENIRLVMERITNEGSDIRHHTPEELAG